ncbi:MAG TPA: hypothetical protein VMW11_09615 [Candidatus Dormibacteraeota bacterium]|nr:hypothetical protein [Candidatus Dormibacteraeota bacterium]
MRKISKRDAAIGGATIGVAIAVLTQVVGPRYIDPLPVWSKGAIALVCFAFIGAVAVYGRRRSRRV